MIELTPQDEKDLLFSLRTPEAIMEELEREYVIPYHFLDAE